MRAGTKGKAKRHEVIGKRISHRVTPPRSGTARRMNAPVRRHRYQILLPVVKNIRLQLSCLMGRRVLTEKAIRITWVVKSNGAWQPSCLTSGRVLTQQAVEVTQVVQPTGTWLHDASAEAPARGKAKPATALIIEGQRRAEGFATEPVGLPRIKSIEELMAFEKELESSTKKRIQLKKCMQTIEGDTPRENTSRILRKMLCHEKLVAAGTIEAKGRRCLVIDSEKNEVRVKLHWIPFYLPDNNVRRALEPYGKVTEVTRETWRSTTRISRLTLKDGVTVEQLPHQLQMPGCTTLVLAPGRAPLCLRCRGTGHIKKECCVPHCDSCRHFGHTTEDCRRTYADVSNLETADEASELVIDQEEAEEAAAAPSKDPSPSELAPYTVGATELAVRESALGSPSQDQGQAQDYSQRESGLNVSGGGRSPEGRRARYGGHEWHCKKTTRNSTNPGAQTDGWVSGDNGPEVSVDNQEGPALRKPWRYRWKSDKKGLNVKGTRNGTAECPDFVT
ncbi:hypothetical protein HPB47_018028 [Ixodes persulcatus]|uniref:Uncharacterized protein n=1 Tax=Ixodes persulcatus TaxID=34615 RepID=A0AC60QM06_IXOPE|nr:hypothetical protein HPB47_018028 [Ixodes persulcatus]